MLPVFTHYLAHIKNGYSNINIIPMIKPICNLIVYFVKNIDSDNY